VPYRRQNLKLLSYFKAHKKDVLPVTTERSFLIKIINKLIFLVYS